MKKSTEIWIVDKDEVLANTLANMLEVNDLTSNFKIFNNLHAATTELNNGSGSPQAILADNGSQESCWEFAQSLNQNALNDSPHLYLMDDRFKNDDLDQFANFRNVKRLFTKPLRLDELKWIMEKI